jgi:hypothetical protein
MGLIQFTHIGKATIAVNPELIFCIESYNEGNVGAYTRIFSAGQMHVDVRENFATVMELLRKPQEAEPEEPLDQELPETTSWDESSETEIL